MKLKEIILSMIYGKKCPKCDHRNHLYLLDDNKKCIEDIKEECQFKPFDRVLVRDDNFSEWQADIFSNLCKVPEYPYVCVGGGWAQCILYKGNEELLGTHNTK